MVRIRPDLPHGEIIDMAKNYPTEHQARRREILNLPT